MKETLQTKGRRIYEWWRRARGIRLRLEVVAAIAALAFLAGGWLA